MVVSAAEPERPRIRLYAAVGIFGWIETGTDPSGRQRSRKMLSWTLALRTAGWSHGPLVSSILTRPVSVGVPVGSVVSSQGAGAPPRSPELMSSLSGG